MSGKSWDILLEDNPRAKRDKDLIRQALRDLNRLRAVGIAGDGYSLLPPFGEKGHVIPQETEGDSDKLNLRQKLKMTDND